ncbi:MAG TPA: hypothetical protein VH374_07075 [Polyangia bacterium]|jgi:chitinase|nr:hypothetical protein [Polyangia bacterium]
MRAFVPLLLAVACSAGRILPSPGPANGGAGGASGADAAGSLAPVGGAGGIAGAADAAIAPPGSVGEGGGSGGPDVAIAPPPDAGFNSPDLAHPRDATPAVDTPPAPSTNPPGDLAPYLPIWTWGADGLPYGDLADLKKKTGLPGVTIAFVLADGGCQASGDITDNLGDVKAFIKAGGHVKASFGGQEGTYVESRCNSAGALAAAISDFVDATGITDLDFDIEQDPMLTDAVNAMRAQALKMVQDSKHIKVAFTLEAEDHTAKSMGGLNSSGQSVVRAAVTAGLQISHVNFMTMDFGDNYGDQPLAPVVIGSLTDGHTQLMNLVPGLTSDQAWAMVGVIPMIGQNDDAGAFSLDDARAVAQFAISNRIGLVAFWSTDRDCDGCSGVDQNDFDFTRIFSAVTH